MCVLYEGTSVYDFRRLRWCLQVVYSLYSTSYNLTFPFTNAAASTAPPPYDSRSISGGTLNGTVLWGALEACVTDFESTFYSNEALLGKWGGGERRGVMRGSSSLLKWMRVSSLLYPASKLT